MSIVKEFSIDASWPEPVAEGARDLADLYVRTGDETLTTCTTPDGVRGFVRVSAVSVALWLVDNWWRLRWEAFPANPSPAWRTRHELSSGIAGVTLPPVMIYGIGTQVMVAPNSFAAQQGGPLRFLPIPIQLLDGETFERGVAGFVSNVIETCAAATDGAKLARLYGQLCEEKASEAFSAWRRLEARLGFDPDKAPEEMMATLAQMQEQYGEQAIEEAASAAPGPHALDALETALDLVKNASLEVDLGNACGAAALRIPLDLARPTWFHAEEAALKLRQHLALGDRSFRWNHLEQVLGAKWATVMEAPHHSQAVLKYAAHSEAGNGRRKVALDTQDSRDRRFEMSRILGDAIWSGDEALGFLSRAKTDRQRFQRAFAQALLSPPAVVQDMFDDLRAEGDDVAIGTIADHFGVKPQVIRAILVSKKVLLPNSLVEQLETAR